MVVNEGEFGNLEIFLCKVALYQGLYKNVISPSGPTTWANIQEMPTGGGRSYAPVQMARVVNYNAPALNQWYLSIGTNGKAQALYSSTPIQWLMSAQEVADGNTVQGSFRSYWKLPFQNGAIQIREGDVIKGAVSGATAVVTAVNVLSGTWGAGTAAGFLYLEIRNANAFNNGENLTLVGIIGTVSVGAQGGGYAVGDIISVTQSGAWGAKLVVTSVGGAGAVTGLVVVDPGQGFSAASGLATTHLTGSGNDALTVNILTLATTTYAVSNSGTKNAGDAWKMIYDVIPMATPQLVNQVGLPFTIQPLLSEDTDTAVTG
jgi:hypothetical protein